VDEVFRMKTPGPPKAERIANIVALIVLISVAVSLAFWFRSLLSVAFAVFAILISCISFLRNRKMSEEESIRRLDKAMGNPPDDPRHMGNFVP
jgi:cell division septal protein FtsQ